jgi:hypothetical protein
VSWIPATCDVFVDVRSRRIVDTSCSWRGRCHDANRFLPDNRWERDGGVVGGLMRVPVPVGAGKLRLFLLKLQLKANGCKEGLEVVKQVLLGHTGVEVK